jgi:alpha-ketoglutarate-dependent taurine dioxygenase
VLRVSSSYDPDVGVDGFGAFEVVDFDVAADPGNGVVRERLRARLVEHGVLCIRLARRLEDDELRSVVELFGAIKDPVARARDGSELRYSDQRQVIDSGFVMTEELREQFGGSLGGDAMRPGLFEFFHTDDSYTDCPAAVTVLHARALPESGGGATSFMDMRAAYQSLDDAMQQRLIGLEVVHSYNNRDAFPPRASASGPLEELVDVRHPVVRAHPVSAEPALYFDLDRASHVIGMDVAEGRALLQSLQDHSESTAPRYAHEWQPSDVLVWDNASVQHRAGGDFPVGEERRFWRYMVEGTKPISYAGDR